MHSPRHGPVVQAVGVGQVRLVAGPVGEADHVNLFGTVGGAQSQLQDPAVPAEQGQHPVLVGLRQIGEAITYCRSAT